MSSRMLGQATMALLAPLVRHVDALTQHFLFANTRDTLTRALTAVDRHTAYAALRAGATRGGGEFWLDVCLIVAALLIAANVTVALAYCLYTMCIAVPREARYAHTIRSGNADYQQQQQQQRKRCDAATTTTTASSPSVADDMKLLSRTMQAYKATQQAAGANEAATTTTTTTSSSARTQRSTPAAVCAAVLRGTGATDVHLLLASPAQTYLLVGTRGKRKATMLYTQADTQLAVQQRPQQQQSSRRAGGSADDAAAAASPPLSVLATVQQTMSTMGTSVSRDAACAEVYAAGFSVDDTRLVVGERSSDVFFVFALHRGGGGGATVALTMLRAFRLPARRLVSSLPPQWHVLSDTTTTAAGGGGGGNVEALVCLHDKDCEVEVIACDTSVSGGAVTVASTSRDKFRVGHALAWAQHNALIVVAGSFLRQPRLATLTQRSSKNNNNNNSSAYQLETTYTFSDLDKRRVLAMALVQRGSPAYNTRNYLVIVTDDGDGVVYDLDSLSTRNAADVVCRFDATDDDDAHDMTTATTATRVQLLTAVQGKAYAERLTVALVRGASATVLRQRATAAAATDGAFALQRVADLRDVHDGAAVKTAALLRGGDVLATCSAQDDRGVRLFAVPAVTA